MPRTYTHAEIMRVLTGLLIGLFVAILSTTIVATALPTIIAELNGTQTDFSWIVTAALLANAATTPIWGRLADLFDKKMLVQISLLFFIVGSLIAGFASTIAVMMVGRVFQGIAMGGLVSLAQAIIGTIITPRERGRYSGYMGSTMAVGMSAGPLLGGLIVESPLGWRWTFFIGVPLAIFAMIMLQAFLKIEHVRREVSIDYLGAILMTAGVSTILIWVSFAGKPDYYEWISPESAALVGGGLLLLVATVFVEARAKQPIIPLKIITKRTTGLAIIASLAVGVALFASNTFLSQYFQLARGYSPTAAGALSLPMVIANAVAGTIAGMLVTRLGKWKIFLVVGAIVMSASLFLMGTITVDTSLWLIGGYLVLLGIGMGMIMQNLVLAVQNSVPLEEVGAASSNVAFFRSFGGAIGVSVLGAVFGSQVTTGMQNGIAALPANAQAAIAEEQAHSGGHTTFDVNALPEPLLGIARDAYGDASGHLFLVAAFVSLITIVAVLLIKEVPLRTTLQATETGASPTVAESADENVTALAAGEPITAGQPTVAGGHRASGPVDKPGSGSGHDGPLHSA